MRKIRLFIACSLDGFIASENGEIDWLFTGGDYGYKKFYDSVDTALMGRKTYELGIKLGEKYTKKRNIIFTRRKNLKKVGNAEFVRDIIPFTRKLKREKGKDIWLVGGGGIVSILLNNDLIDEMQIFVHPFVLGKGIPLFPKVKKDVKLKLTKIFAFRDGLVRLGYIVLK